MFPETRSSEAPGPIRIMLGIVLMAVVAMWTFAAPSAWGDDATAEPVVIEVLQEIDAANR